MARHARVVRFTDVSSDRINEIKGEIEGGGGPPEGVPAKGIRVLADEDQGTAVVIQIFDSKEDMEKGAEFFDAMDSSDTPGTRASVDSCEEIARADM